MSIRTHLQTFLLTVGLLAIASSAPAQTVVGSKHDLSTPYESPRDVCAYCHTPHFANTNVPAPLWNRVVGPGPFQMYTSPTMDSPCPATPTGPSVACLGCHDGVLAYVNHNGNRVSSKHDVINAPGPGGIPDQSTYPNCERCHPEYYSGGPPVRWIGLDLQDDHPISMAYPTPAQDPAFNTPPDPQVGWAINGGPGVRLYGGKIECSTCHNVHNPTNTPFLRVPSANDELCRTCHIK